MVNYRYKINGEDVIVSEADDKKIQSAIDSGGGLVDISGGVQIHTKFISLRKETSQMTEAQGKERRDMPILQAPIYKQKIDHEAFFKKINWDWETSRLNPKNFPKVEG